MSNWLNKISWNDQGLIPVIIQDAENKTVLMHAWMNKESLSKTIECGKVVYWSRSRQQLWLKGEQSGNFQEVKSIRLDCDNDTLLLTVKQVGGVACHTGRAHCFYQELVDDEWKVQDDVIKSPESMYGNKEKTS